MEAVADLGIDAGFVAEARAFLDGHARRLPDPSSLAWGEGSDELGGEGVESTEAERAWYESAQDWRRTEFDAGFGWLVGPKEYGGRELPVTAERLYRTLKDEYDLPRDPFTISLGMVAPAILRHGMQEVRDRYLRGLHRGDLLGCQMFSEPGAGSDLASVSTRAVRDGDEWVLNGQKVWTSLAHLADIGEVLCRTDPSGSKHRGLTAFVLDMTAPGVEVRPLKQMNGGHAFNEVFLTDVRIPDSHRLGEVDRGWVVAISTLMGERALGVGRDLFGVQEATRRLIQAARELGDPHDQLLRQNVAACWVEAQVIKLNGMLSEDRWRRGFPPGPAESITKISNTEAMRKIAAVATELIGPSMVADTGAWGTAAWGDYVMHTAGCRIAAGTDEIMRNILAERVLGLPKDAA
ncbi:MAG: acyl-CoA dehydrogenase family protein [Mycobacteriales bacterium]